MSKKQRWTDLEIPLSKLVLTALRDDFKFQFMTPVQASCIPLFCKNKDVAAEAVTGSGKTLAFTIPLLEILQRRGSPWKPHEVGAVVISPTRELALQTWEVLQIFLKYLSFSKLLLVGGNPVFEDVKSYKTTGANIIVATPGRFEDLLTRQHGINLVAGVKALEVLVLDEADRLLDMGFEKSINNILKYLPKQRRTGLFSATQTKEVQLLVRAGLRNPVVVSVKEKKGQTVSTPSTLENYYVICNEDTKLTTFLTFMEREGLDKKYIVFVSTCACVEWFHIILKKLCANKIYISCLHGKMGEKRHKILSKFRKCESGILICTDILARGIDIPEVDWVVQLDPPSSAVSFVHRVGRTARNGLVGRSLLLLLPTEDAYIEFIKTNQKVELTKQNLKLKPFDVLDTARNLQLADRANFDRANRAFVSYVQSYAKHECSILLRVKDLNMGRLAAGFGLLRLPKMPELKGNPIEDFTPVGMDYNTIKYTDALREEARQKNLQTYFETNQWPSKNKRKRCVPTVPWEESKKRKVEKKEKRKERKDIKAKQKAAGCVKKKKKKKISDEDMAALAKDVALISKFRRKKITENEFNKEFGDGEFDDV